MTEREIVRRVYQAYRAAGMTDAGAWGMLGNAMCESTLCPYRLQSDFSNGYSKSVAYTQAVDSGAVTKNDFVNHGPNGGGYGFYQWTFKPRKERYYTEARKRGCSIGDLGLAIDFSLLELRTDFAGNVWPVLCRTDSISEASNIVCKIFENPQVKNYTDRYKAAVALREKYAGSMDDESEPLPAAEAAPTVSPAPSPPPAQVDEDGIPIPKTWPPRTIDQAHCSGWPEVKLLQALLLHHGYNVLTDGIWSAALTEKLKAFQRSQGLQADGVAGKLTWIALGISPEAFNQS